MKSSWPRADARSTWCEFKGPARYLDAVVDSRRFEAVAWTYPDPSPGYEALRDHVAFYPGRVDAAWLDDERVQAQQSDFYGGWITADLVGPFKGPRRHARLVKSRPVDPSSPAAIPEVASVEVVELLLKHSAAGLITSRRYGSQPVDALDVLVNTRASRDASQRRVPHGEACVRSKAGQLAKFGSAPLLANSGAPALVRERQRFLLALARCQ